MLSTIYWQYSQALPWVLALLVVLAGVLLWAYRPQLRQGAGAFRWLMPILRLIALAALAVSILRPVVSRPRNQRERGPVVVLLDNSRSMSVIDTGRPVGQWVAIASALRRLPDALRNSDLQVVQSDCDRLVTLADDVAARAERDYAKLSGGAVDAAVARLDQSTRELESVAHDAADHAAKVPHAGSLERTLSYMVDLPPGTDREQWLSRIGDKARDAAAEAERARITNDAALYRSSVGVRDACEPLQSVSRLALAETAVTEPVAGLLARLEPDMPVVVYGVGARVIPVTVDAHQAGGRISPPLIATGDRTDLVSGMRSVLASLGDSPVRAVVLFSDGRQVDADNQPGPQPSGVPVFCVGTASHAGVRDLTISDVTAPSSAFVGETTDIHVQVRGIGLAGQATVVSLKNGDPHQSHPVSFTDDRSMPMDFKWTPTASGPQRVVVEAARLPGEISLENNRAQRWIRVFDRKCRIAIAGGSDSKDVDVARRALGHVAWGDLTRIASGGPVPWSVADIGQMDVVVLSGLRADSLTAAQDHALQQMVKERGGSVVLVPAENGSFDEADPVLSKMLPLAGPGVTGWRTWPGGRPGFQLSPVPGVHNLDFGQPGDSFWQLLPAIASYVPLTPLKKGVRTLLVESQSGTAVLTESRFGRGRVFCLGANETWRWGAKHPDYPQRFWQMLLHDAAGDPTEASGGGLSLDVNPPAIAPGDSVQVRARVTTGVRDPASVLVRCRLNGKLVRQLTLLPAGAKGSGWFEATVSDLPEGDYQLEADAGPSCGHPILPLAVHPSDEAEMTDLTGDDNWLRRLAESSGGQFYRLDQIEQLPDRIRDLPMDFSHPVELALWDGPYLYVLVLGCFATEWGLRKRFGLA